MRPFIYKRKFWRGYCYSPSRTEMASMNFMGSSAPPSPQLYQATSNSSMSSGSRSSSIRSWGSDQPDSVKPDNPTKNDEEEEVVYLAMGKEVKEWHANLSWVLKNIPRSKKIAVLHVHRPSKTFNMSMCTCEVFLIQRKNSVCFSLLLFI
jgi:hypothetical protein